jgi:3',5'-cyclic AMP phosphodiesterase CpdA
MLRLAHFSDVHLTTRPLGWRVGDVFGKRTTGWVNVVALGRGRRFKHAATVTGALLHELRTRNFDHLIFSGDATTLAFRSEMQLAAKLLGVGDPSLPPAIAVPGNHDLYTRGAANAREFEAAFGAWQEGERVDGEHYPFAQKAGHVWLIGLNSATANFWPWDATGKVGEPQLDRLKRLCASLSPGPRVVVSHYPIVTSNRKPEPPFHRLRDFARVRDVCGGCGIGLWLHGHKHGWYVLEAGPDLPFPTVCAGSSTQTNRWGYHEYALDGAALRGLRRVYDAGANTFRDAGTFALDLPPG